jgi:hypothetical protein
MGEFLHYIAGESSFFAKLCRTHADSQSNSFTTAFISTLYFDRVRNISAVDADFIAELKTCKPSVCLQAILDFALADSKFMKDVVKDMQAMLDEIAKIQQRTMTKADSDVLAAKFGTNKMLVVLESSSKMITTLGIDPNMWKPFVNVFSLIGIGTVYAYGFYSAHHCIKRPSARPLTLAWFNSLVEGSVAAQWATRHKDDVFTFMGVWGVRYVMCGWGPNT